METLILFHLLDDSEILDFYHALYSSIDQTNFLLLYLYSDKLEETIRAIQKERSDGSGAELWYQMFLQYLSHSPYGAQHGFHSFEDMVGHLKHRQNLELRILNEAIGGNAIILPSKEWDIGQLMPLVK